MEQYDLPDGWVWTTVAELYDIVGGGTPSTKVSEFWSGDIAWITSADIYNIKDIRPRKYITNEAINASATNLVPPGSIIVVTRVGLGKVAITNVPLCFSQDSHALVDNVGLIDAEYILHYLSQAVQEFKAQSRGTTIAGVTKEQLAHLPIALPPLPEQQRIIARIEALFAQIRSAREALDTVPTLIKQFRQSVLAAAFRGDLTERDPNDEPASVLLERIRAERRRKWEDDLQAKGKHPAMFSYEEPASLNVDGLPELPEGWAWASVGQTSDVVGGIQKTPARTPKNNAFPYLRVANVLRGRLDLTEVVEFELFEGDLEKWHLEPGDVLVVEGNGSLNEIGRCAVWNGEIAVCVHQNHLIRVRLSKEIDPYYFNHYLNSVEGQNAIAAVASSTSGLYTLSVSKVQRFVFPVTSWRKQKQIVENIEVLLTHAEAVEQAVAAAHCQLDDMEQSILARAFRGELVPQNPDNEPASALLERIRAERVSQPAKQSRRRKA